jgi:hypothetical protein
MLVTGNLHVHTLEKSLECELGRLVVEDERLSGLPQGIHQGFFEITGCRSRYSSRNSQDDIGEIFTVKIMATLGKFAFLSTNPCTTARKDLNALALVQSRLLSDAKIPLTEMKDESDAELFGELWPLGAVVKIDPAQDRAVFDKQRLRLKALNYSFDCKMQTWHKNV